MTWNLTGNAYYLTQADRGRKTYFRFSLLFIK